MRGRVIWWMEFVGAVDYVRQWHKEVGDKLNDDNGIAVHDEQFDWGNLSNIIPIEITPDYF